MDINNLTKALNIYIGTGTHKIKMFRGNFDIHEKITSRHACGDDYSLTVEEKDGLIYINGHSSDKNINRTWIRIPALPGEHVVGGGEQFSYLDLRGRKFPIWTREQGVGRNKHTLITRLADVESAGGDYYTTFFPQPTFISSQLYFVHLINSEYSCLDFTNDNYHEICVWSGEFSLVIGNGANYEEILYKLTGLLGRQKSLPDWAIRGIWLGVQGGTDTVLNCLKKCEQGGIDIPAVWIQDWEGKRITSFGKRLQWDWRWNEELYPRLDEIIASDSSHKWMGYINPYLVQGGKLFEEAEKNGYFVKNASGSDYLFDFGEYDCGVVDLTMPAAYEWYKNVIKHNLIGLGLRGWMADFGEYLPHDAVCFDGNGMEAHNRWPLLWAKCNREAIQESGMEGKCVFFMRSGWSGCGKYSTLAWAGDQNVDFSVDDGLPSVITAALSLGMSGYGLHTCDCGGYTTLFHLKRTPELMKRWLEYSCFTPVMRTHEGNRPDSNVQMYTDDDMIQCAAYWSKVHNCLSPYILYCMQENEDKGLPVQRPLFMSDSKCDEFYSRDLFEYMLGDELLVAPVVKKGKVRRSVVLPTGTWVNLWTHKEYASGRHMINAPIGMPPVFYLKGGKHESVFAGIADK